MTFSHIIVKQHYGSAQAEAQKKLYILEGDIGVFSYSAPYPREI